MSEPSKTPGKPPADPTRGYAGLVNRFSATRAGTWLVRHVASHVDPLLFKATNGRFTLTGVPTLQMLTLTAVGRRSGQPRAVQLAYLEQGDDRFVVASAMGQEHHPAWSHNLEANPEVDVQVRGARYAALATRLDDAEKAEHWSAICKTIPQMTTYERRTDRNIRVYRLSPR